MQLIIIINCNNTATTSIPISTEEKGVIAMNATARFRFTVPVAVGMTFNICISDGEITIYASTIPNPSSAQYTRHNTLRADDDLLCLSTFYDFEFTNQRRKRRQISNDTVSLYITLKGENDVNEFTFNSSVGNTILNFGMNFIRYYMHFILLFMHSVAIYFFAVIR